VFKKFDRKETPTMMGGLFNRNISKVDSILADTPRAFGLRSDDVQKKEDKWQVVNTPRAITRQLSSKRASVAPSEPEIKKKSSVRRSERINKWYKPQEPVFKPEPTKKRKESEDKETRWSKENDRQLFVEFERVVTELGIDIEEFKKIEKRLPKIKKDILTNLKEKFDWRGTIYSLRNRIQKRLMTPDFTAREQRVLKRKLREYAEKKLTLEQIADHFAGKTVEQVEKFKNEYFKKIGLE
jgi:hypothetical protein